MIAQFSHKRDESFFGINSFACADLRETVFQERLFRILWITESPVELKIDGRSLKLGPHKAVFLTPNHNVEEWPEAEAFMFSFNSQFYCIRDHDEEVSCHGYLFYGSSEVIIIDLDQEIESFKLLHKVILDEFRIRDHIQNEMLQMLLKRWILKCTRLARKTLVNPEIPQTQLDLIRQFNVLVEKHFKEKRSVAEYADMLARSPKTLSNLFAQYNHKSPLQVINDRILLEARRLLMHTDFSVKEIAHKLGYESATHFTRFFKRNEGVTPTEFLAKAK